MTERLLTEETIFAHAQELGSAAERAAFLDRACGDNRTLRAEVEAPVAPTHGEATCSTYRIDRSVPTVRRASSDRARASARTCWCR